MENKLMLLFFINADKVFSLDEPHPDEDDLINQVVNEHMDEKVMDHVGKCSYCSKELLNFMIVDQKITNEFMNTV